MVSDPEGGLLNRMKERRVFLFEQLVIFSEPLDKKKGFSLPGFLYKNSIKVPAGQQGALVVTRPVAPSGGESPDASKFFGRKA